MRVLHVYSNISKRSGVMSCIMNYYFSIDTNRVQFDFLYYDKTESNYEKEISMNGGVAYVVPDPRKIQSFIYAINGFYKDHYKQYDIIEVHDPFMFAFLPGIKKKIGAKCIVAHGHSTRFSDHIIGEVRNRLLSISSTYIPDYYFACSTLAGKKMFGSRRFEKKGIVIHNAINLQRFINANPDKIIEELDLYGKYVVGHIGHFNEAKNHDYLVDVFNGILKKKQNAVLVLVGEGEFKERIKEKCDRLGIEKKVLFIGTRTDVPEILKAFDVFVFPSKYEGLGIALIEAQAAGVPCVCSTNIPREAQISNVTELSLNEPIGNWVKAVLNAYCVDGRNIADLLAREGYSIDTESKKLIECYESLMERME